MSTKRTLYADASIHIYIDGFHDDGLYLDVEPHIEGVRIPFKAFARLASYCGDRLREAKEQAGMTDEQIRQRAAYEVDERIEKHRKAGGKPTMAVVFGGLAYGDPDAPRETQIANGIEHYTDERKRCRRLLGMKKEADQ